MHDCKVAVHFALHALGIILDTDEIILRLLYRKDLILQLWEQLLELLKRRRSRLEKSMKLQRIFQEMINTIDWMDEIKVRFDLSLFGTNRFQRKQWHSGENACLPPV